MSFGTAVKTCFGKLFVFNGRARRSEFWWFYLFLTLVSFALTALATVAFFAVVSPLIRESVPDSDTVADEQVAHFLWTAGLFYGAILLLSLVLTVLLLGAQARRLHDTGQSAHWLWFHIAGLGIVPLIMCIMEGQPFENQYGPDPKALPAYGS